VTVLVEPNPGILFSMKAGISHEQSVNNIATAARSVSNLFICRSPFFLLNHCNMVFFDCQCCLGVFTFAVQRVGIALCVEIC
jgi:hypothetical protein